MEEERKHGTEDQCASRPYYHYLYSTLTPLKLNPSLGSCWPSEGKPCFVLEREMKCFESTLLIHFSWNSVGTPLTFLLPRLTRPRTLLGRELCWAEEKGAGSWLPLAKVLLLEWGWLHGVQARGPHAQRSPELALLLCCLATVKKIFNMVPPFSFCTGPCKLCSQF